MSWSIRSTESVDHDAVLDVVRDAFSGDGRDGSEEIAIVRDTWSLDAVADGLDLVAADGHAIVGHALDH